MSKIGFVMVLAFGLTLGGCGKDKEGESKVPPEAPKTNADDKQTAPKVEDPAPTPPAAAAEATVVVPIEAFGYQIDAPESWKGKQLNPNVFTMDIGLVKSGGMSMMPTFAIMKMPKLPESLEKAATCANGKLGDKEELDGGAFYYVCDIDVAGQTVYDMQWYVPLAEGGFRCNGSGPDLSAIKAACASLRKL